MHLQDLDLSLDQLEHTPIKHRKKLGRSGGVKYGVKIDATLRGFGLLGRYQSLLLIVLQN